MFISYSYQNNEREKQTMFASKHNGWTFRFLALLHSCHTSTRSYIRIRSTLLACTLAQLSKFWPHEWHELLCWSGAWEPWLNDAVLLFNLTNSLNWPTIVDFNWRYRKDRRAKSETHYCWSFGYGQLVQQRRWAVWYSNLKTQHVKVGLDYMIGPTIKSWVIASIFKVSK